MFGKIKEIALEAVNHDDLALQYAAERYQSNIDVVLEAIKQNPLAIEYASKEIKNSLRKVLGI
ncbi:MAG: DUF4116 domain-containing protein [Candidatus Moraniibacteriota bacterium]